jgi:hypothetical protein
VCWESTFSEDQEDEMTETAPRGRTTLRASRTSLTKDQIFRLWEAAIKDDDNFVDEIIRKVYDDMTAFDSERRDIVIDLTVRRHKIAGDEFRTLLSDMQEFSAPTIAPPLASPPARLDS